ncbi:uncharacterized protein LOC143294557 [Babylonia areolata]|uniref:uncharacterized protein LOC143294557 n=1 Tax=Babylonia areolata TaxID=304850 RepID=UPI003FD309AF
MSGRVFLFYCCCCCCFATLVLNSRRVLAAANGPVDEREERIGDAGGGAVSLNREKRSDDFSVTEAQFNQLAQLVTQHSIELLALRNQISQLQTDLQTARKEVGFFAFHQGYQFTVNASGTVILNRTYTNSGNAFDTHKSTFTAPVSGLYAFFLTISVDITINGTTRSRAFVNHSNTSGDSVWTKSDTVSDYDLYGSVSISGFLVQAS